MKIGNCEAVLFKFKENGDFNAAPPPDAPASGGGGVLRALR